MAKKIKREKVVTEEEKKAEEQKEAEEAQRAAAGIQDEFQARGFELVEWMQEKQGLVLAAIGAVLVAGLGFGIYTAMQGSRNTTASASLATAIKSWEAPVGDATADADPSGLKFKDATERATEAKKLFEKTAADHGSTGAGALAHLYAGHAALRLSDYDGAAKAYQAFLDGGSKDDALRFAGYAGLAHAQEAKGDTSGAIASLEALVNLPDTTEEDAALLALGRLHKAAGNADAAKKSLERIGKDFPESSLKSKADELLSSMGVVAAAPAGVPKPEGGLATP
jgi:TolA-binding protein